MAGCSHSCASSTMTMKAAETPATQATRDAPSSTSVGGSGAQVRDGAVAAGVGEEGRAVPIGESVSIILSSVDSRSSAIGQ
jgi:hypothetical protein